MLWVLKGTVSTRPGSCSLHETLAKSLGSYESLHINSDFHPKLHFENHPFWKKKTTPKVIKQVAVFTLTHLRAAKTQMQSFQNLFFLSLRRYNKEIVEGAQWLCGRVLVLRLNEPHLHLCVLVLEQVTFILAKYWFNPGRSVPI